MNSPTLITGDQLASILGLSLPGIKLDQYVRVRRVGASHKEAADVVSYDYIRVNDYSKARVNGLSHKKIMELVKEGYDLKYISLFIATGYSLKSAKQAHASNLTFEHYALLRRKGISHGKIMEVAQMRRNGEYEKWDRLINGLGQGMSLEAALDYANEYDD